MDNIKGTVINAGGNFIVVLDGGKSNFEFYRPLDRLFFFPGEYDIENLKESKPGLYIVRNGEME